MEKRAVTHHTKARTSYQHQNLMSSNDTITRQLKARIYNQAEHLPKSELPRLQMYQAGKTTNNKELKGKLQLNTNHRQTL